MRRDGIRGLLLASLVTLLVVYTSSCGDIESSPVEQQEAAQRTECYTYFTLSADKKLLTWHHQCPPNVLHKLWTAERKIHINRWQPGKPIEGVETMVAKARDIQVPESLRKKRPEGEFIGYIKCTADWTLVRVNLGMIDPSGEGTSYARNGTYDLKYLGKPEDAQP